MRLINGVTLFFVYALFSSFGLYLLKVAPAWISFKFTFGAALYIFGAGIWLVILRTYPLSIAFPIASGLLMLGTTVIGYFILNENLSWMNLMGIFAIFSGIAILTWGYID